MNLASVATALIIPVVLTALTPLVTFFVSRYTTEGQRARAEARLRREPNFHKGARIRAIYRPGVSEPLLENCYVSDFQRGRVEIRTRDGQAISFTGLEYERLHPVYELSEE